MDVGTIGVLVAVNAYFGYVGVRALKEAQRFGPLMTAAIAAGLVAIAIGQVAFVLHDKSYVTYALAVGGLCPLPVLAAIWRASKRPR